MTDLLCYRRGKLVSQNHLKKLEKKERHLETKIDQRLEKLDMKRKKVLEKAALRAANKNQTFDSSIGALPFIMSGIATKESLTLPKRVKVWTFFVHQWQIINDGTVTWNDVRIYVDINSIGSFVGNKLKQ